MSYVSLGLRAVLLVVLVWAAVGKLRAAPAARNEVAVAVAAAGVPQRIARPVATGVLVVELAASALLCWPAQGWFGALAAAALMAAFVVGVARVVRRGRVAACACFGAAGGQLGAVHLARNAALLVVAVAAVAVSWRPYGAVSVPLAALAVAAGVVAGVLFVWWEDIAAVLIGPVRPPRGGAPRR